MCSNSCVIPPRGHVVCSKSVFHTQATILSSTWLGYEARRNYDYSVDSLSLHISLTLRRFQFLSVLRTWWSCEAHA